MIVLIFSAAFRIILYISLGAVWLIVVALGATALMPGLGDTDQSNVFILVLLCAFVFYIYALYRFIRRRRRKRKYITH
jgi:membrane protein implicated in regulation of membrane protease activity